MSTLQEHLEDAYDVDVDQELELRAHPEGHPELEQTQRFIVDDEDKATWALRKLARALAEYQAISDLKDREIARIEAWEHDALPPIARQVAFFEGLLKEYHRAEVERDPSKKTIKLPAGTLKSIAGQNKWTVVEPETFLAWFDADPELREQYPNLVKVTRTPSQSAIKATFEPKDDRVVDPRTGEIVPGVTVEPGERRFTVAVAE